MSTPITIVVGSYPGCWPGTPQEFVNNLVIQGFLNENFPGIIVQPSIPDPQYQNRLWFNSDPLEMHWYQFVGGLWIRPHPVPPSSSRGFLWFDTLANLWTEDKGTANADPRPTLLNGAPNPNYVQPTDTTGSFWIPVDAAQGRTLIHPGIVPGASIYPGGGAIMIDSNGTDNSGSTTGVTQDSLGKVGEYAHTLLLPETPTHRHLILKYAPNNQGALTASNYLAGSRADGQYSLDAQTNDCDAALSSAVGGDPNNNQNNTVPNPTVPHMNLPPYYSCFFIKRTQRKYIVAT